MHVLHLTTEFPWPATSGGPVRTLSQLRILASLGDVDELTLMSLREGFVPEASLVSLAEDLRKTCKRAAPPAIRVVPPVFHPIHLFDFKLYVPRVVALRALRGVPYLAGKWHSRAIERALRSELRRHPVDVVYIDHLGMAHYLPVIAEERPLARVVLDQHNVESDFFAQFAERKQGIKKLAARLEARAARAFEQAMLRSVSSVVAISAEDAHHFRALSGVRAHVVPVVMDFVRTPRPRPARVHFCYVGSLRWHPNVAGLDWFCREVWPLVRARLPSATFEIAGVGLKPDERGKLAVPEAWNVEGVETVGFLENLEPLYARSLAMIAPVFGGSGVRLKLLEGFRAGMPVITTPDGAFGLPLRDGHEALIAREPRELADRIARAAEDDALRDHLREGGYRYLEAHHSLAVAQHTMRDALGVAAGPKRDQASA